MRISHPTDFVCTDFSRTDEMPYRKKTVSMIRIFIRVSLLFHVRKTELHVQKTRNLKLKTEIYDITNVLSR